MTPPPRPRRPYRRLPALAFGVALAFPATAGELSIPHEMYTLDNGLTVVLAPDRSAPIVHTEVWYHVGSKDETPGLTGFAHLFEHLMFQGSLNSPGEYFTPLQQVGADLNGTTNSDRTNYYETLPSNQLPLALFMESDRMGNLLPVLDQGKLDNQREVVRNERRQRYENPPYGEAFADLMALVHPEGHPYHHPTIGSHEDLQNASLDDVKAFFRTWYVPNNATLVVAGDFDTDTAKSLVEAQFGWIPRGADPVQATSQPFVLDADKVEVQVDDVPDAKVWLAWPSPALYAPGDAELDILSSLLCDAKDGRLQQTLVKRDRIARDVACFQVSRALGSTFIVAATAADGHTTDEVVDGVLRGLRSVLDRAPPEADEVSAAVTQYEAQFYGRLETIAGKAGTLASYLFHTGTPGFLQRDLQRYLDLTPEQVRSMAAVTLRKPYAALHIRPTADASETTP